MPRNGSGQYNLPYDWNDDKANGIKILASRMQGQDQDIANALTGSISSDGQTPLTGNLDFNGNKAVDLLDGTDAQDATTISQAQTGELQYYGLSSTIPLGTPGEDYEVNANPTLTEYVDGLNFSFLAHITCLDNPVIRVDVEAELNMVKDDGAGGYVNCIAGDVLEDHVYDCTYNEAIGADKLLIKNPEKERASIDNLTVNKTIAANVFSSKKVTISNNASDPSNDIDFSAGSAFDTTNNVGFFLASTLTKRLDATWAAGTNQGGLDTGVEANSTWYYCYAIYNPTTNIADALFSINATTPTLPSGYTHYKKVGSIYNDSSGVILPFDQFENKFILQTLVQSYTATPCPTSKTDITTRVPPTGVLGIYTFSTKNVGTGEFFIRGFKTTAADVVPDQSNSQYLNEAAGAGDQTGNATHVEVAANSSSQISVRASAGSAGVFVVSTQGWIDPSL